MALKAGHGNTVSKGARDEAHRAEVELQFGARSAVGDAHRCARRPPSTSTESPHSSAVATGH